MARQPAEEISGRPAAPALDFVSADNSDAGMPPQSDTLAVGATIPVQLGEVLDSDVPLSGAFILGRVPEAVAGADGKLAIPAGSTALLVRREPENTADRSTLIVSLYSVSFRGHQYRFPNGAYIVAYRPDGVAGPRRAGIHLTAGTRIEFRLTNTFHLQ